MKKTSLIVLIVILAMALAACGETGISEQGGSAASLSAFDPESGEWTGLGGSYAMNMLELSDDYVDCIPYDGKMYCAEQRGEASLETDLFIDGQKLCSIPGYIYWWQPTEAGIWLVCHEETGVAALFISADGEELCRNALDKPGGFNSLLQSVRCQPDRLFIISSEAGGNKLTLMDSEAQVMGHTELPEGELKLRRAADGQIYAVEILAESQKLYTVDGASGAVAEAFSCPAGNIYDGAGEEYLLLETADGLYTLEPGGSTKPIVIWEECSLDPGNIERIYPLGDGKYFVCSDWLYYELNPVEPREIKQKTRLRLVSVFPSGLEQTVARFNSMSQDCYISIEDYSNGMEISPEDALLRLNTEIISGNYPDMICFSGGISPYTYIAKGLLLDLRQLIDADESMGLDDISIANALEYNGGIYFLSSSFVIPTLEGRAETFGDRYGWSLEEFMEMDSHLSDDQMCIYNLDRDLFMGAVVSRYVRKAVDWEKGTCSFDTSEFKQLLQTALDLRETPEDPGQFGPGAPKVGAGEQLTSAVFGTEVYAFALEEKIAGCRLSFVGWPTVDGSCGTDIQLMSPLGICRSENREACWNFMKFMMKDVDTDEYGFYTYRPALEESIRKAQADDKLPVQMSDEDVRRLMDLINAIDSVEDHDKAIMNIINEESAIMFSGDKTVDETAKLIQSRASIYVAEQR